MHTTLLAWLQAFKETCSKETPTSVYNSLVMLGVEMPNSSAVAPRSGNHSGCDCLQILQETRESIQKAETDLADWLKRYPGDDSFGSAARRRERICTLRDGESLYVSLHESHAEYNKRAHEILKSTNMLQKVRAVCLRDLRAPVKHYESMTGETSGSDYCPIALKSYGELLKTFLVETPEGWF
jgi:hypothetical protein